LNRVLESNSGLVKRFENIIFYRLVLGPNKPFAFVHFLAPQTFS
jgi:hypothetical protein